MPKYSEAVVLEVFKLLNNVLGDDSPGMGDEMGGEVPPVPADDEDVFDDEAFGVPDDGDEEPAPDAEMADEPPMEDEPEPHDEPDGDEEPAKYAADCEDGEMARYDSSAMSAPSATNVTVPSTIKKEKARMGRSTTEPEQADALKAAQAEIAKLMAEIGTLARYNRKAEIEARAAKLAGEHGIELDIAEVVEDTLDLDEAKTERYFERVKARYTRSPEKVGNIAADAAEVGSKEKDPWWFGKQEEIDAAFEYNFKKGYTDAAGYIGRYRKAVASGDAAAPQEKVTGRRKNYYVGE